MSMLRYYCNRAVSTRGLEHKSTIANLRNYIKTTPTPELLDSIAHIHEIDYLKALWEAGLTIELQTAVLRRIDELITRRTP